MARSRATRRVVGTFIAVAAVLLVSGSALPGLSQPTLAATTLTFAASGDALVKSTSATKNFGTQTTIQVRAPSPEYRTYVRFTVGGLVGSVTSAKLRLWVTDPSPVGGQVDVTSTTWTEAAITWTNAPAPGNAIGPLGIVATGTWAELSVPVAVVTGNGTYSFAVVSSNTKSAINSSL